MYTIDKLKPGPRRHRIENNELRSVACGGFNLRRNSEMQNLSHPQNNSLSRIENRASVPNGFKPFDDTQQRKFQMTAEELAMRTCPGAFINCDGRTYFSPSVAAAHSCRVA